MTSIADVIPGQPAGVFARALQTGFGVTFGAADFGADANAALLHHVETSNSPKGGSRVVLQHERLRIQVIVEYEPLQGHQAVRLSATLRNVGDTAIPHVRDLQSLALRFDLDPIGDPTVRTLNGGTTFYYFPPRAFQVFEHTLLGGHVGGKLPLAIDSGLRGRSSQGHIPLFLIGDGADRSGTFGGLEWSGDWQITFGREGRSLVIRGGSWGIDLTLWPGEEIPFATALIGFYEGNRDQGANALRRCLLEHYVPSLGDERHLPPVYYHHWFQFQTEYNEEVLRAQVDAAAELGIEYFEVDAA